MVHPENNGMLFDCSTDNVGLHLKNIFSSVELVKDSVTENISAFVTIKLYHRDRRQKTFSTLFVYGFYFVLLPMISMQ